LVSERLNTEIKGMNMELRDKKWYTTASFTSAVYTAIKSRYLEQAGHVPPG